MTTCAVRLFWRTQRAGRDHKKKNARFSPGRILAHKFYIGCTYWRILMPSRAPTGAYKRQDAHIYITRFLSPTCASMRTEYSHTEIDPETKRADTKAGLASTARA